METTLVYIGKAAIAAGAFYIAYLLLFQNQKHFMFNRIYLPVSLALSFVIPLITFTTIKYIEPVNYDGNSFAYLAPVSGEILQTAFVFEWYHYLFGLYLLGIVGFLFHLLLGHIKAIKIIQKSRVQKILDSNVNITKKDVHPFSFFSKIVVSEKTLSHPDLEIIVSHEKIHVREKHTLDILFTEIMFLFQWFNPFAWLLKDAVKNNLEYLTDNEIAKHYNPQTYQLAMVTLADKQGIAPFLTALNGSQLKNRIIMMKKKTENKFAVVKQLAVLPLLAILVMGLSNKEVKTEIIQTEQTEIQNGIIIKGNVTDEKGDPMEGASIIVKGTTTGTITDSNGNYELQVNNKNETLSFLVPDFETVNVDLNGQNIIDVQLKSNNSSKNGEVKVTTSGTKNFTLEKEGKYVVSGKVTNEKDEPVSGVSVVDKGKMTGTNTDTNGNYEIKSERRIETLLFGKDGYEMVEINVNNRENLDLKLEVDNKLYIVDGKEYETKTGKIDTDNIERIDVLKGESGSKLYGDKGKNGVVLITTKKVDKTGTTENIENSGSGNTQNIQSQNAGYIISGGLNGTMQKGSENVTITPSSQNGLTIKATGDQTGQPLYLVDGVETKNIEQILPENIERIDVLKDKSATSIYGDKGKNGVILITLKNAGLITKITSTQELRQFIAKNIQYPVEAQKKGIHGIIGTRIDPGKSNQITSGEDYDREKIYNLPMVRVVGYSGDDVSSFDPVKDSPLLINEIERVRQMLPEIDIPELKGKLISLSVEFELQKTTEKQTIFDLRKKIAQSIKYPVVAQENNQQGVVEVWASVAKDATISNITDKKPIGKFINVDEVVVTALKSEKAVTSEKSKDLALLVKESKRVIEQLSPLTIPELAGETVCFRIRFVLE